MTVSILEWVVSGSALILVVLLLRGLLGKRISAGLRYGLWAVVLARLLVPVSVSLAIPVPQLPVWEPPEIMQEESIYILPVAVAPIKDSGIYGEENITWGDANSFGYPRLTSDGERVVRYAEKISPLELLRLIWIAGAAVFSGVVLAANLWFSIRLRRVRRPLEDINAPIPVYVASALPSPCLTGVLRPAVYITEAAAENPIMLRHVLVHELTHCNQRDHLWSFLRGAALAVHWWNPLVWLAVVYSRRDGELACDAGTIRQLGEGERAAYGETLLKMVIAKARPVDLFTFATTMSGSNRNLKERIHCICCKRKQLVSAFVAAIIVIMLSVLIAFGQAKALDTPNVLDSLSKEPSDASVARPNDAWQTAKITLDEDGTPSINYVYDGTLELLNGSPVPAPREWADQELAGRDKEKYLTGFPEVWGKLLSPADGWLVACYNRGTEADTYVYKTEDGGMTWPEAAMPGTGCHIVDVGFLSMDRLIVAQRLSDGTSCFITKDGGETWEVMDLPYGQVLDIGILADAVYMNIGEHKSDPAAFFMISYDMGDTWSTDLAGYRKTMHVDLDHDGRTDMLSLRMIKDVGLTRWYLQFIPFSMSSPAWIDEAGSAHVGWTSFYWCRLDGEDYLLKYTPYMGGGACEYSYKLFYLKASGEEVVVQENSVEFDLIFNSDYADQHQYDPQAINAFIEEINDLLANSEELVNTDENLLGTFEKEGRLYDNLWWLDDDRDENLSLLENLERYGNFAQDLPDDT